MSDSSLPPSVSAYASLDTKENPEDLSGINGSAAVCAPLAAVPIELDLSLDENHLELSLEPLEQDNQFVLAAQGDLEALQQLLNHVLAKHQVKVTEVECLGGRLQLSLMSDEVPCEAALVPLIQGWIVQLGLVNTHRVEVYGYREHCELPFWRSEFQPAELELARPRQRPPKIEPVKFAFSTPQSELEPEAIEVPNESVNVTPTAIEEQPNDIELDAAKLDRSDRVEPVEDSVTLDAQELQEIALETQDKQVIENSDTLAKRKFVETFLARYAAGERAFTGIDLSETDLSGINLTLADLQSAQLIWANLQEASLYHVNLLGAKLRHANLKGAKLRSANLRGADFLNADLSGADLSWSNLTGANLTGADLTDANLKDAVLDNVIMPDGTRLD